MKDRASHMMNCLQCIHEITRLEGARKDLMMGIIDSKRQQISAICNSSHMIIPPLPAADAQEPGEVLSFTASNLSNCFKLHSTSLSLEKLFLREQSCRLSADFYL